MCQLGIAQLAVPVVTERNHPMQHEQDLARIIRQTAVEDNVSFVASYSGRGMYSRTCAGVITSDTKTTLTSVAIAAVSAFKDSPDLDDIIRCIIGGFCVDNMGSSTVLYWPSINGGDLEDYNAEDYE